MAVLTLPSDITATGINQDALVTLLTNLVTVVNELVDDHATNKVTIDESRTAIIELIDDHATARTELIAIGTTLADFKAIYDAHCHTADGNASRTSVPDSGSPTGSPSAASVFTDTSGSSVPATLTAGDPTASAAALTNSTDLTLLKG